MKTAEQIIKVLKERYIDAHCNPDFKGDKMEYIFQPLPEQTESAEEYFRTNAKDWVNNGYTGHYSMDKEAFLKYAQSHQVEMPSDEEIELEFPTTIEGVKKREGFDKMFYAAEVSLRMIVTLNKNKQDAIKWFKSQIK